MRAGVCKSYLGSKNKLWRWWVDVCLHAIAHHS